MTQFITVTGWALASGVSILLALVAAYSAALIGLRARYGTKAVWAVWLFVLGATIAYVIAPTAGARGGLFASMLYSAVVTVAVPTGGAAWLAVRLGGRERGGTDFMKMLGVMVAFLVGLPIGVVAATMPLRLLGIYVIMQPVISVTP